MKFNGNISYSIFFFKNLTKQQETEKVSEVNDETIAVLSNIQENNAIPDVRTDIEMLSTPNVI